LLEFLDESFDNDDEIIRKPILPKNLNLKNGITIYNKKLEEKKKQDKITKEVEKLDTKISIHTYSPKKWRADTDNTGKNN
jgi:RNase P/RNase MRP subunit p30